MFVCIIYMIYKYSQLTKRISYTQSNERIKTLQDKPIHWGQLKLFLSELLFLSIYTPNPYTVLYVGAAEGTHISLLADLFPKHKFILYDPRKFVLKKKPNITTHNKLFTNEEALKYTNNDKNILFISDIRVLEYGESKQTYSEESDEMIYNDMTLQMDWVKMIKPKAALLKFRTLYTQDKFEYFDGTIYLQQYSPISTETRILVTDYTKFTTYNAIEFDEKMAYYNCCVRPKYKSTRWVSVMDKLSLKNTLDMENMLYILEYYLIKTTGMKRKENDHKVIELFKQVGAFFKHMNSKKYETLLQRSHALTIKV
jgi:hypothetical protein